MENNILLMLTAPPTIYQDKLRRHQKSDRRNKNNNELRNPKFFVNQATPNFNSKRIAVGPTKRGKRGPWHYWIYRRERKERAMAKVHLAC